MKNNLIETAKQPWSLAVIGIFALLCLSWVLIHTTRFSSDINRQIWAASYQVLAFIGGFLGIFYSKLWGGSKSLIGRGIMLLSIGLLLQCFGQSVYSFFIFFMHIEVPYPSLGDIGFFGSVIFYILAIVQFARAAGVRIHSQYFKHKSTIIIVPALLLGLSYIFFLRGYTFDWNQPLKVFLDFGYPFGEALYVSVALVALLFSRELLGGVMKQPITFLLIAFIMQYISDFSFLYQSNQGTWSAGGVNDLLYAISYLSMTLGIIYIGKTFFKIKNATT